MSFTVYILFSEKFNKHYTGFTSDLSSRVRSHSELGNEWTARYRPWKLIYKKEFKLKSEAMAYEKWLKRNTKQDFEKSVRYDCHFYKKSQSKLENVSICFFPKSI